MPVIPNMPKFPAGAGLRQEHAAQLRAEMEAKQAKVEAAVAEAVGAGSGGPQPGQEYTLHEGDTLESIARQVEQEPERIWSHEKNGDLRERRGTPGALQPGDALYIPLADQEGTGPVGQGDYVVRQGDSMASLAIDTGHFWETIWNAAANAELKEVRQNPYVLLPFDRVTIPEINPKTESGETEERHRFVRKGAPEILIIRFLRGDEPRANEPYLVDIDGTASEGVTDADGQVEIVIPPDARRGNMTFPSEGDEYELDLGHLDPITELSGVQTRLRNLGFFDELIDGEPSEALTKAIRAFQKDAGIEGTGELDDDLRAALVENHGS